MAVEQCTNQLPPSASPHSGVRGGNTSPNAGAQDALSVGQSKNDAAIGGGITL